MTHEKEPEKEPRAAGPAPPRQSSADEVFAETLRYQRAQTSAALEGLRGMIRFLIAWLLMVWLRRFGGLDVDE